MIAAALLALALAGEPNTKCPAYDPEFGNAEPGTISTCYRVVTYNRAGDVTGIMDMDRRCWKPDGKEVVGQFG